MPPPGSGRATLVRVLVWTLLAASAVTIGVRAGSGRWLWGLFGGEPPAHAVVLVVLDTVRADHTSLCGYGRPTTPFLASLAARGAAFSCRAYAPAGWTLPSHVSYLSGVPPTSHGADYDATIPRRPLGEWSASVRVVPQDLPLLAEQLIAEGYQTVLVSANPVLVPAGLGRGFAIASAEASAISADDVVARVEHALDALDPRRPLFLVVNLMDAHAPWTPVPDGIAWVPSRARQSAEDALRIMDPATPPAIRAALLAVRTDLYDYGVSRADDGLRRVFDALQTRGWLVPGSRVVVAADHGELLGEHGRIDHGLEVYEPQQRVPLVAWGIDRLRLPEPLPAIVLYDLLRRGRLPARLPPVVATQLRRHDPWGDAFPIELKSSAARWDGTSKTLLVGDEALRFDLAGDPGEADGQSLDPGDATGEALRAALSATVAAGRGSDPGLTERLRAMGYVH